ncbi:MAG TPA: CocE/NonD family hydrolase [Streptosporangiaceae bacterium]
MPLVSRAFGALLGLPPAETRNVEVRRDVAVPALDGTPLLTDLYLARPDGPRPTILIRTPYGRRGIAGGGGLTGRFFAERGYHSVVQSTRGTHGSGGEIEFDREAGDGRATADWIAGQAWSNGELGTFGASYLSFTQLALASTRPPQLKAMSLAVWGAERRAGYFPGGSFALDRALTWAYGVVVQREQSRLAMLRGRRALRDALGHLPLLEADVAATGQPVGFYRDWLEHSGPGDPYWAATDFRPILADLGVPVTMTAGWYDTFLPLMLADYRALRDGGQQVRLHIGPWRHASPGLFRASLRDALEWFGVYLRHQPPPQPRPPVSIEVMGGGGRRALPDWPPPAATRRWHLQPGGALSEPPPPACEPDLYRYDPAEPTPAAGGTSTGPNSGPRDNRELEARPDVLTYSTGPLAAAVEITGPVRAELYVSSSLADTDFFARLCDVGPKGRSVNVTDGLIRLTANSWPAGPDAANPVVVDLWPAAHRFAAGHRIRLQVSSGAHPRFARNLGSGEPLATATSGRVAEQTVHHDPARPSAIVLPVPGPAIEPG